MRYFILALVSTLFLFSSFAFGQLKKDTIQARRYFQKADSLFQKANYTESITYFEKAAQLYKKYSIWSPYSISLIRQVENHTRLGAFEQAEKQIASGKEVIQTKKLENTESDALLYNQIGFLYLNKGRNDLALENYQKALSIFFSLKKVSKTDLASCYNNLGIAYWNAANNELALEHIRKSLALRQAYYGEGHPEVAACYNNLGLVYASTNADKALENYQKAEAIYEKVYDKNHPNVAIAYNNIAIIYRKQKKYDEALANFQKVLFIYEKRAMSRHSNQAFLLSNIGQVYLEREEYDKALSFQLRALELYIENYGEKHPEVASTYNQLAAIYNAQEKIQDALEYYQKALVANTHKFAPVKTRQNPSANDYYNANILLYSLAQKARIYEQLYTTKTLKLKDLETSLASYYTCDTLIQLTRNVQTNKNDKIELGKLAANIYEEAIRVCLLLREGAAAKVYYAQQAFYFSEKSKASVLLEAISETEAKHFANIPDSLIEKEQWLKSEISFYEQKLAEKMDAQKEQLYRDKLFASNRAYETFIEKLEKNFPEYYELKYNVKTTTVKSIQASLHTKDAIISYFVAENSKRMYLFYITKKDFQLLDVKLENDLSRWLIGYRNAIKFDVKNELLSISRTLYDQLLPMKISKKVDHLIIIPDGKLGTIPFETLVSKNYSKRIPATYSEVDFLIKKYAVSYSYSVNLYEQQLHKKSTASESMFLCAPISFSGHQKNISNLPSSAEEVKEIEKILNSKGTSCYSCIGKNVQEGFVKSGILEKYKYLHFATHGVVDELHPELSEIYLSPDTSGREDGNLYSGEIYNLRLNADLVTLSACETGLGKVQRGEGIIGLTRALIYAGAHNIIVSLWSVADYSTSQLMIDFYTNISATQTNSAYSYGLQKAKVKMLAQEKFDKPYFWAPFIMVGK